jgi:amylosucrase
MKKTTVFTALLKRLAAQLKIQAAAPEWQAFVRRVEIHGPHLRALFFSLYGERPDVDAQFERVLGMAARAWMARPAAFRELDGVREADPRWFQSEQMLGGIVYVDLFARNLKGLRKKIPYFKELGLTYLHLMPLFKAPEGNSDGGYAVSSYREVDKRLGDIGDLRDLINDLRDAGISVCVDFIFNHTSDEHEWATRAIAGEATFRDYYLIMPRAQADAYDANLREIFPDQHPGGFSPLSRWTGAGSDEWVWTTFNSFQWDLNYANPEVFAAMGEEMLAIANLGVDVVRMDAVAFIWKRLGTDCENQPEAHTLIQAFNALARIAAPSLLFKSEAIVHPDQVAKYIRPDECQISYNPLLMALLWNSLATRNVDLLAEAIRTRSQIHADCAWVNYVRCHDDIGWTFSDEDAARLGINGYEHRRFLNAFYTGRFEGSFAKGVPFQENPKTGDCRISGMCASLAGLEQALDLDIPLYIEHAIRRILLVHGVVMSYGGIPLIYLNDELGALNDYGYQRDPDKAADSRWTHRPAADLALASRRKDADTTQGRIYQGMQRMIAVRKTEPAFSTRVEHVQTGSPQVLGYAHHHAAGPLLVLANFSEQPQPVSSEILYQQGMSWPAIDLLSGAHVNAAEGLSLSPYQMAWLKPA